MYIFSIVLCTSVYIVTIYLPSPHTLLTLYQCHNVIEPLRTKLPWGDLPLEFEVVQYYHPLAAQYIMARLIRSAPPPPPPPPHSLERNRTQHLLSVTQNAAANLTATHSRHFSTSTPLKLGLGVSHHWLGIHMPVLFGRHGPRVVWY